MKSKKHKINFIVIFGAVFIFGGIISIFSAAQDMYKVLSAKHRMQIDSSVISVRVESDWVEHSNTRSIAVDSKNWITEEEIPVNGQILIFHGQYPSDPGGTVKHTVISNDGIHWEVNDSNSKSTTLCIISGIICSLLGVGVIIWLH